MKLSILSLGVKKKATSNKQKLPTQRHYLITVFFLLFLLLPNIALAIQFYPLVQALILSGMALAILLLPSTFLPIRIWLLVEGILLLLLPLDLASWLSMRQPITDGFMLSVWHTNQTEAIEQLRQYVLPIVAYILLLVAYFIVLFKLVPSKLWLPRKLRFFVLLPSILLVLVGISFAPTACMPQFDEEFTPRGRLYPIKWVFNHTYPFDVTRRINAVRRQLRFLEKSAKERGIVIQPEEVNFSGNSEDMLGLFIIGETSRACNWQLAGYHRETTPRLAKRTNLYFFDDVFAGANFTLLSVPQLISEATPQELYKWNKSPMLTEILHTADYYQGWISIQSLGDVWMDIARRACNSLSLHTGWLDRSLRDEVLLPRIKKFFDTELQTRTFLVTHTVGGHYAYTKRYTESYAHFKPELEKEIGAYWDLRLSGKSNTSFVNSFDNTIVYTDMILDSIISYVEEQHKPAFVLYIADHGENLLEPPDFRAYHSYDIPSHYEAHVPLFIWLSDEYKALYPATDSILRAHQHLPVQSTATFYTLLELAKVSYITDSTKSLISPYYCPPTERPISNPDGRLCPEPPYNGGDICPAYSKKEKASKSGSAGV